MMSEGAVAVRVRPNHDKKPHASLIFRRAISDSCRRCLWLCSITFVCVMLAYPLIPCYGSLFLELNYFLPVFEVIFNGILNRTTKSHFKNKELFQNTVETKFLNFGPIAWIKGKANTTRTQSWLCIAWGTYGMSLILYTWKWAKNEVLCCDLTWFSPPPPWHHYVGHVILLLNLNCPHV